MPHTQLVWLLVFHTITIQVACSGVAASSKPECGGGQKRARLDIDGLETDVVRLHLPGFINSVERRWIE